MHVAISDIAARPNAGERCFQIPDYLPPSTITTTGTIRATTIERQCQDLEVYEVRLALICLFIYVLLTTL